MKLLLAIFSLFMGCNTYSTADMYTISVTINRAVVYEENIDSGELSEKFILFHGDKALVTAEKNIAELNYLYITSAGKGSGYILKSATMNVAGEDIDYKLDYNGKVTADTTIIYFKNGDLYEQQELSAAKSTEIKIINGYNNKNEYTFISVYIEGEIITVYVKTLDIEPYGINPNLVIGISLTCTILGIVFIIMGFRLAKKKKKS